MPDTYSIYQDGKTFANESDEKLAIGIFNMVKRTFPQTEVKLIKWRPEQGFIVMKHYNIHKNSQFIYHGRNFEDAVNKAIQKAKTEAQYPSSPTLHGIKQLHGERAVFRLVIEDELKKAKVPKILIKKLME